MAGVSYQYHHPERMEITQPRVARHELPWEHAPKPASYPEEGYSVAKCDYLDAAIEPEKPELSAPA